MKTIKGKGLSPYLTKTHKYNNDEPILMQAANTVVRDLLALRLLASIR